MASAVLHLGVPLKGFAPDLFDPLPAIPQLDFYARQMDGWRFEGRAIRPWPNLINFGGTKPNSNAVTLIKNILWRDNTSSLVRHTGTTVHQLTGGVWSSIVGATVPAATATDYWSGAVCRSSTAPAKGLYLFTTDSASQIFFWDGTANISNAWASGTPSASRHVIDFADRAVIFNQIVAGAKRGCNVQWSRAGECLHWTGSGSGSREVPEVTDEITAVSTLRDELFVYSPFSIVRGVNSYDLDAPIYYSPVAGGLGCLAPGSFQSFHERHIFLSFHGFKLWDGSQIRDIGTPIDRHIFNSINRSALDTITSAVLPAPFSMVVWNLPMFGATTPNYVLAYDYLNDCWLTNANFYTFVGSQATALCTLYHSPSTAWSAVVGTWAAQTSTWSDMGGFPANPVLISGHANGATLQTDITSTSTDQAVILDYPRVTLDSVIIGRQNIGADAVLVLDEIEVIYRIYNDLNATQLLAFVSSDNGRNFTHFGTASLNTTQSQASRRVRIHGRVSGETLLLRLATSGTVAGNFVKTRASFGIEDTVIRIKVAGKHRSNT